MKELKLAVVGSRSFTDYELMKTELDKIKETVDNLVIVSGGAKGADTLAERYARENILRMVVFRADWSLGKGAGMMRNAKIIDFADAVIAFQINHSAGTQNTIDRARIAKKPVRVINGVKNDRDESSAG